jgi:hypothetical protein
VEEADDLGDALGPDVGAALGGVDPAEVGPPVELGDRVPEGGGLGVGLERRGDVGRQVVALRTLR